MSAKAQAQARFEAKFKARRAAETERKRQQEPPKLPPHEWDGEDDEGIPYCPNCGKFADMNVGGGCDMFNVKLAERKADQTMESTGAV